MGILSVLALLSVTANPQNPFEVVVDKVSVTAQMDKKPVFEYKYADVPFKPYVRQFWTPNGVNILRDAPHDHLHHHALMFAVNPDDVDFWGETETCGKQIHQRLSDTKPTLWAGVPAAGFTEENHWLKPGSKEPTLVEHRSVYALSLSGDPVSLLSFRTSLDAPKEKPAVVLSGRHYVGLGMRFVESMDKGGRFFNSDNAEGEIVRGDERNFQAKWCAYTAQADGKPVTVAMFSHPKNPRPATWFTMSTPFSYLAATLNLHKETMTIEPGKSLELGYGIALWDGEVDANRIQQVFDRWVALQKGKGGAADKK